jgi:hypothetical protein
MFFRLNRLLSAAYVAIGLVSSATLVTLPAHAQSNATGNIYGQVEAASGLSIVIENLDNGSRRTITPDDTGRFQATSLATGSYKVSLIRDGAVIATRDAVVVRIGQGSEVAFVAKSLDAVVIQGRRNTIDATAVDSTTTFTASELARMPVASNVGAVVQLAPSTTRSDSRYGGDRAASFGGAGATENGFYINGFPVTNPLLQIGASSLPFDSIAQAQVLTGGYGAEFGRATGGVVNITTKAGTNEWLGGVGFSYEPNWARSRPKDSHYAAVGVPETDGQIYFHNRDNKRDELRGTAYLSGPLVKDKLFMYLAVEQTRTDSQFAGLASDNGAAQRLGWTERRVDVPRYLAKLDWTITDDHRLEYTRIGEKVKDDRRYYGFDYDTLQRGDVQNGGDRYLNWGPLAPAAQMGSDVNILKYTGYLTQDLTLTALLGDTKSPHEQTPFNYRPDVFVVRAPQAARVDGINYTNLQPTTFLVAPGASDETQAQRLDLEYKLTRQHTLRGGVDRVKIKSVAGTSLAGGGRWSYERTATPDGTIDGRPGDTPNGHGGFGSGGYYVVDERIDRRSAPTTIQSAQYIEDRWQVTRDLLVSMGLRNEQFDNKNGDGQTYVKQDRQIAPRLGMAWDVSGDSSMKIFGTAGRYHLPLPTNVAVRAAGNSLFTRQTYTYTGVDPVTGAPIGLTPISSGPYSNNNELGQARDPRTVTAQDLKANYQDELALGFEKAVNRSFNFGTKFTYRTLRSGIDDFCDGRPFDAYVARNGLPPPAKSFEAQANCFLFNPGQANSFMIDIDGDGTLDRVDLSAADLGYPKLERKYAALDLFFEKPFDGRWYAKLNYTLSKNWGNTEGQVLSDIGQGDVSTTQAFDFPELMEHANGLLPNDRKHQFKLVSYFQATPEWGVGLNGLLASGRPKNCIGSYPNPDITPASYGSAFFYCNGVATPRGSQGRLPWDFRVDMNVVYKPELVPGLGIKLDAFNVLNRQTAETIDELHDIDGGAPSGTYTRVISYTAPRSFRLSVQYDYKF